MQTHKLGLTSDVGSRDWQLSRTKGELRTARATIHQLLARQDAHERQDENLQRRLDQARADKVAAQALGQEAAERAKKLDAKLAVGLHQRGMGAVQREAKAAKALLLLKERDQELAAARREAMLLRLSVSIILPLSLSVSSHQFGVPGLCPAPTLTNLRRKPGVATRE